MICQVVRLLSLSNDLGVLLGVVLADWVVNRLLNCLLSWFELLLGALTKGQWPGGIIESLNGFRCIQLFRELLEKTFRVLGLVMPLFVGNALSNA